MKRNTLLLLLAVILLKPALAHAADLSVEVTGLRTTDGKVMIGVYDNRETFLRSVSASADLAAATEGVRYVFKNLEPGAYTVAVFHDLNGNGKLDKRPDGIPSEPTALSRSAIGRFGPPHYEDAVFTLPASGKKIAIKLYE